MPSLRIAPPVWTQILPKDGIPLDRLECNTLRGPSLSVSSVVCEFPLRFTLEEPTPLLARGSLHPGEIRAAAGAIRPKIDHEGANSISTVRGRPCPVVVVSVVARGIVPLRPHAFNVEMGSPALERASTLLDATHGMVAVQ